MSLASNAHPGPDRAVLAAAGIGLFGVADGRGWGHVWPGCRSIVVVGNAGDRLWEAFGARASGGGPDPDPDPLDAFVARAIARATPHDAEGRWVRCAADATVVVDFRALAVAAGFGWRSRLGIVIHPHYGPWFALRGAWFSDAPLAPTGPLPGAGPCASCDAPCAAACPANAIATTLQIDACGAWRAEGGCDRVCDARRACPIGAHLRYPADQEAYHHRAGATGATEAGSGGGKRD